VNFIAAEFRVRPQHAERWPEITAEFTAATRAEAGCLWFDWSRSVDHPNEPVLIEAFVTGTPAPRTSSPITSARRGRRCLHTWSKPRAVNMMLDQDDWSELGEMTVDQPG
jgi:hypothetical protein